MSKDIYRTLLDALGISSSLQTQAKKIAELLP